MWFYKDLQLVNLGLDKFFSIRLQIHMDNEVHLVELSLSLLPSQGRHVLVIFQGVELLVGLNEAFGIDGTNDHLLHVEVILYLVVKNEQGMTL